MGGNEGGREISEEVERRVALPNQQSEGELMMVKNRVREIMNGMGPLTEEVHTLNEKMERTSRLALTALSAWGATETPGVHPEDRAGLPMGLGPHTPLTPLNYNKTSNNRRTTY